jgi:hypothetical protein
MRRWNENALPMRRLDRSEYFGPPREERLDLGKPWQSRYRYKFSTIIAVVKWETSGLREGPQLNPVLFREPRFR